MFTMTIEEIDDIRVPQLCVCVELTQSGPWTNDHLQEVNNIVNLDSDYETRYMGRELLDIEWIGPNETSVPTIVDHWVKGPHHFWVLLNGTVVRMNTGHLGQITILTNYRELEDSAQQAIDEGPLRHEMCGLSNFPGIGCGPTTDEDESNARLPASADALSRARNWFPRAEYRGDDFEDMTSTLNIHLKSLLADSVGHRECSDFTIDELNDVMRLIHAARDPQLQSVYEEAGDPRSLGFTMPAGTTAQHLEDRYMAEKELIAAAEDLEDMMRDGKCHETVMWFVHHLSTEAQFEVASMIYLPLLPTVSHAINGHGGMSSTTTGAAREVENGYIRQILCTDCHLTPSSENFNPNPFEDDDVDTATVSGVSTTANGLGGGEIAGIALAGVAVALVVGVATRRYSTKHSAGVAQQFVPLDEGSTEASRTTPRNLRSFKAEDRYESLKDGVASIASV
jgi:hypothetical protein